MTILIDIDDDVGIDIEIHRRVIYDFCVRDGEAAARFGRPLESCPPYVIKDMAVSWRTGWWREMSKRKK